MSKVDVQKVDSPEDRSLPVFAEFDKFMDRIRSRANELFHVRGMHSAGELDDWLTAEREYSWPAAELEEDDKEFDVKVALAGFDPEEISVTASPRELIVRASHEESKERNDKSKIRWSEFRSNEVFRRVELPEEVDVKRTTAKFKRGLLEIEAPKISKGKHKSGKPTKKVPVSSVA